MSKHFLNIIIEKVMKISRLCYETSMYIIYQAKSFFCNNINKNKPKQIKVNSTITKRTCVALSFFSHKQLSPRIKIKKKLYVSYIIYEAIAITQIYLLILLSSLLLF